MHTVGACQGDGGTQNSQNTMTGPSCTCASLTFVVDATAAAAVFGGRAVVSIFQGFACEAQQSQCGVMYWEIMLKSV
jgi:hypothetical protein